MIACSFSCSSRSPSDWAGSFVAGVGNSSTNSVRDWRQPGIQGQNAQQFSASAAPPYHAELDPPATSYTHATSPVHSTDVVPGLGHAYEAPVVDARFHREGIDYAYSHGSRGTPVAQRTTVPESSKYQPSNVNLFDYVINRGWYICYPAASVMLGGMRNQGLSERVPQLVTRNTGGPGTDRTRMTSKPFYTKVQNVPRYSTLPQNYDTTSINT